jgi:1-deoxy-D-xylulose-5-phosphate reductoisomerase
LLNFAQYTSMKRITILGSTGSIGTNSLDVISRFPEKFSTAYLTTHTNIELLATQAKRFRPKGVVVMQPAFEGRLKALLHGENIEVLSGPDALSEVCRRTDTDFVIGSMVGFAGLVPTLEAIKAGKDVGLANKETLVVAGSILTKLAKEKGVKVLPIDSEHSAVFQCLAGESQNNVGKIILTASGGPFRTWPKESFQSITVAQALNHPNWKMGKKITIDSATLMNKGLEVIEAKWLFNVGVDKIQVVVHPQSIIHSMVEFKDGSIKAQLGVPDMKIPIQYALSYPDRFEADYERLDWTKITKFDFEVPDLNKFRCLALAFESIDKGGSYPTVLNAANEAAVDLFLNEKIPFVKIWSLIENELERHAVLSEPDVADLIEIDRSTRRRVYEACNAAQPAEVS